MTPGQRQMVELHLAGRGITDPRVLDAFRTVPRDAFLPPELADLAWDDAPQSIGEGQTISQPYIVALTAVGLQLKGPERVLEIGTGSGYAAAIFACLAAEVFTIERFESLAEEARARLQRLGFDRVHVRWGDGTLGWPDQAPFDAIAVAAAGPRAPPALLAQLTQGGRLVIPIGGDDLQTLVRITRVGPTHYRTEELGAVRFVPLIGAQGHAA